MTAVFWGLAALLAYTFAGYPLLLRAWAGLRPRPVAAVPLVCPVVVVIVAHNEAARIQQKVATCKAQDYPAALLRVLVVSDGSTDGTAEGVRSLGDPQVQVLAFATRRGKAACLVDAVQACHEDIIVFNDARQPLHPQAVRCLVENFADPAVGGVSGELVFRSEQASGFSEGVGAYWDYEKSIRRHEALVGSVVGATGALYAIRRRAFQAIPARTILDDVLVPMNIVMQGSRVVFDSRAVAYDQPSVELAQERRRKIRTLAGNFQLLWLRPALLSPLHNPVWLQFISHKVLRLVAPLALAVLLLASLWLAGQGGVYAVALAAQGGIYGLALAGLAWPAAQRWRMVRLPTTFVVLNWFVVLGLREFLANRQAHLWQSGPAA